MRGAKPTAALRDFVAGQLGLRAGETIVVGVSGGPDSVALAALTCSAAEAAGARVVLAHVNHGVRPRAWQDEAVVLALGAALARGESPAVRVAVRALPPGSGDEARLRRERYAALLDVARDYGAGRVATAHHARDQTETVLLALFRGAGPSGLAGIAPSRPLGDGVALVRPLLRIDPRELHAYCAAHHYAIALDPSNADTSLRRNAVRSLLEGVRPHFAGLDEAVARCAYIARGEREDDARARLRDELRGTLEATLGEIDGVSFERLEAVATAIERGRPGNHFLRRGVKVVVE